MRVATILLGVALGTIRVLAAEDWPPTYDIPKLAGVKIDGDATDWGDEGFRIEVLAPIDGQIVPSTDFDATVRLGWTEEGFWVLLAVADNSAVEAEDGDDEVQGDSIILTVARDRAEFVRYAVTPGVDPKHPEPRARVYDLRPGPFDETPSPKIKLARRKLATGYVLEALIPLAALDPAWRTRALGFQIVINDADADRPGQPARHLWYTADRQAAGGVPAYPVRMADVASPPVTTAVSAHYEGFRRARITVLSSSDRLGKRVEISDGPSLKESAMTDDFRLPMAMQPLERIGDRRGAYLTSRLPPLGQPGCPLNVYVDSKRVAQLWPPDVTPQRRRALSELDVQFSPGVFTGTRFPRADFADPELARDLLGGPYSIKTTFYGHDYQPVEQAERPGRYGAVVEITTDAGLKLPARLVTLFKQPGTGRWKEEQDDLLHKVWPQIGIDAEVIRTQEPGLANRLETRLLPEFAADPETAVLVAALAQCRPRQARLGGSTSPWAQDQEWWYPLKQKLKLDKYKYYVDMPAGYLPRGTRRYPLLVFLHGSGERGDDLKAVRTHGPPKLIDQGRGFPFIVVSPQCPSGEWWSADQLDDMLKDVRKQWPVDDERVYMTGLSMGGYGTWEYAAKHARGLAAIVPICGAGGVDDAWKYTELPTWVFHGTKDPAVPFERSVEMVEAIKKLHGRIKFTAYADAGHDSWTRTYDDPELYTWLLKQRRRAPAEPPAP